MDSREERERLKEEYKEHYRQILESRKKLETYERKAKILKALDNIDPSPVLHSFHSALGTLKEKITLAEARIETYLEEDEEQKQKRAVHESDEFMEKERAKETLKAIRMQMGSIENELEKKVEELGAPKTIESQEEQPEEESHGRLPKNVSKTIGPRKKSDPGKD